MKRQKMNGTLLPSLISLTFWEINFPELQYIRVIGRDGTDTQYMIMQKFVIILNISGPSADTLKFSLPIQKLFPAYLR